MGGRGVVPQCMARDSDGHTEKAFLKSQRNYGHADASFWGVLSSECDSNQSGSTVNGIHVS